MSDQNAVVAVYQTHSQAEEALKELQKSGFNMKKLSIVGKDYHTEENVVGYYNAGDRMKRWGSTGAFWGGFWGLLFGSAFFAIPGIGPVLMAGPLVAWVVGALEGAVVLGGLSAIGAGLYSIGIPRDSIVQYEQALKSDKFLLLAHGTAEEVEKARIMRTAKAEQVRFTRRSIKRLRARLPVQHGYDPRFARYTHVQQRRRGGTRRGIARGHAWRVPRTRADTRWADIAEPDGHVRTHPVQWLAHVTPVAASRR